MIEAIHVTHSDATAERLKKMENFILGSLTIFLFPKIISSLGIISES